MWKAVAEGYTIVKGATIVKVLAHTGVMEATKSKAANDGIKLFNCIGNSFDWDGGGWESGPQRWDLKSAGPDSAERTG